MKRKYIILPLGIRVKNTRLTPIELTKTNDRSRSIAYRCKCDCGNETIAARGALASGRVKSCGCYRLEETIKRSTTHGLSKTKEYYASSAVFGRCRNKKDVSYKNYGGRGIKVKFKSIEEMTRWIIKNMPRPPGRLYLDRINNDSDYKPGNLKWSTSKESCENRRCTRRVTINGSTKLLTEWAKEVGISHQGFSQRVDSGCPEDLLLHKGKITPFVLMSYEHERQKKNSRKES